MAHRSQEMHQFNHFYMQEPSLDELDLANQRLACEVEYMNTIEWNDHILSDSYLLMDSEVHRSDIPNHPRVRSNSLNNERKHLMDGTVIGLELGKRALGKFYDTQVSSQISTVTRAMQSNLELGNPKQFDMFSRIHAFGSAETMRLPILHRAVGEYSERKNLNPRERGLIMSGIGFVARNIVTIQRNEKRNLHLLDISLSATE